MTANKIRETFYKESELHNNKTKQDALRALKKKINDEKLAQNKDAAAF